MTMATGGGTGMSDEQSREQLLSCLEDVKLDLDELKQHSSAVVVGQAVELIERLQSEHDALKETLDRAVHWPAGAMLSETITERAALKRENEALLSRLTRATDLLDKAGPYVPFGKETKWLVQHISEFLEAPALSPAEPEPK